MAANRLPALTVSRRIYALILVFVAGLLLLAAVAVADLRNGLVLQKQQELRHLGEAATSIMEAYHARSLSGEMTVEAAQAAALQAIQAIRYNQTDYFWVNDMHPRMVMHPIKPELVGQDLSALEDPAGKRLFVEFVAVVEAQGQGFVTYLWPKPGHDEPVAKESFVVGFAPWGWVVGTGVYMDDLNAYIWNRSLVVGGIATAILVVASIAAVLIAGGIARPLKALTARVQALVDGRLDVDIPAQNRGDEIGDIARAVAVFKANAVEKLRIEEEHAQAQNRAEAEKRSMMMELADGFEATIKTVVDSVATSADRMQTNAEAMAATAERSGRQAASASGAADVASSNVQTVASAAEELSGSIEEIARQVTTSSEIAVKAADDAGRTNIVVEGLVEAAQRIGTVVGLIRDIADQTNLLALNATIEAARAGDAGKGFAVVAAEVKSLANQTAKATEDISGQIEEIQGATTGAAEAIRGIGGTIAQINEIASGIAAAVEEQGVATQEIARNVQEAASGTQQVSGTVGELSAAAGETGSAAAQVLEGAKALSDQSTILRDEVEQFIAKVRTA